MKKMILAAAVAVSLTTVSFAGPDKVVQDTKVLETSASSVLAEPEFNWNGRFSAGVHGIGYAGDYDIRGDHDQWGAGVGTEVTYNFNKFVGLQIGYDWLGGADSHNVNGSLLLQYPLFHDTLVPYLLGGIDGQDGSVGYHGGLGVLYRFAGNWALYTEGRYTGLNESDHNHEGFQDSEYWSARAGVKYFFGK